MFGYGDNPNAAVRNWCEGRCIDDVLTEDDLAAAVPSIPERKTVPPIVPPNSSPEGGDTVFDLFVNSGRWQNHLADLEALGWDFFDKDGVTYFQTPDGDHSPGKQDGNIKDGVAYIFSKARPRSRPIKATRSVSCLPGLYLATLAKKDLLNLQGSVFPMKQHRTSY